MELVIKGALVGIAAGAVVCAYRLTLQQAEKLLQLILSYAAAQPLVALAWFVGLLSIAAAISFLMVWEPYTISSGIPQTQADIAGHYDLPWHRVLFAKFIEGSLGALAGLSLGREGPSVQLGGVAGKAVAKLTRAKRGEEHLLVTCGAASGMAAAFHAPFTGVIFALEEMHKVFSAPLICALMASAAAADFLVSEVLGVKPVLDVHFASNLPHIDYGLVLLMGILLGVIAAIHNQGMFFAQDCYRAITRGAPFTRILIPCLTVGLVGLYLPYGPYLLGGGEKLFELLLDPHTQPLTLLIALLVAKYILTALCFGSSAPGGTLLPLVIMGALAGAIFGRVVTGITGESYSYIANYTALGIAGLFAGVVRAPITGVVLVFELTGSFSSLLSAVLISIVSYIIADILNIDAFYEHLYTKMLGTANRDDMADHAALGNSILGEKIIRSFVIATESTAAYTQIKNITWPDAMRIVAVERAGNELIAEGQTQLEPQDRIIVLMDEQAEVRIQASLKDLCLIDKSLTESRDECLASR